ncbi:MAG: hypothetical protein ACREF9_17540, partial [Opitutaceae bacterium]
PSDNEFAAEDLSYSPLFVGRTAIRPGKHMEAAVQGLQDAEYMRMLRQVADEHPSEVVRAQAAQLLQRAADLVADTGPSANSQWVMQRDSTAADIQRVEIGRFLDSVIS